MNVCVTVKNRTECRKLESKARKIAFRCRSQIFNNAILPVYKFRLLCAASTLFDARIKMRSQPPIAVAGLLWREDGLKHWEVNWPPRWDKCEDCCDISCMLWPWASSKFCLSTVMHERCFWVHKDMQNVYKSASRVSSAFANKWCFFLLTHNKKSLPWSYFLQSSLYWVIFYCPLGFNTKVLVVCYWMLLEILVCCPVFFTSCLCFCRHGEDMIVTPFAQVSLFMYIWCLNVAQREPKQSMHFS